MPDSISNNKSKNESYYKSPKKNFALFDDTMIERKFSS